MNEKELQVLIEIQNILLKLQSNMYDMQENIKEIKNELKSTQINNEKIDKSLNKAIKSQEDVRYDIAKLFEDQDKMYEKDKIRDTNIFRIFEAQIQTNKELKKYEEILNSISKK